MSFEFLSNLHLNDFTLAACVAEDMKKCCVECEVVWMSGFRESCKQQNLRPSNRPKGDCTSLFNVTNNVLQSMMNKNTFSEAKLYSNLSENFDFMDKTHIFEGICWRKNSFLFLFKRLISLLLLLIVLPSSLPLSLRIKGVDMVFCVIFMHCELVEKQHYKINPLWLLLSLFSSGFFSLCVLLTGTEVMCVLACGGISSGCGCLRSDVKGSTQQPTVFAVNCEISRSGLSWCGLSWSVIRQ